MPTTNSSAASARSSLRRSSHSSITERERSSARPVAASLHVHYLPFSFEYVCFRTRLVFVLSGIHSRSPPQQFSIKNPARAFHAVQLGGQAIERPFFRSCASLSAASIFR